MNLNGFYFTSSYVPLYFSQASLEFSKEKASFEKNDFRITQNVVSLDRADIEAMCKLAFCLFKGIGAEKDEIAAREIFQTAAKKGHPDAQYYLGFFNQFGIGGKKNYQDAASWYKKSADQGNIFAILAYGYCLCHGLGIKFDESLASQLFSTINQSEHNVFIKKLEVRAAEGDSLAQHQLGFYLQHGICIKKDEQAAVNWYKKSAKQNNRFGMSSYANCLDQGIGIERNQKKAFKCFKKLATSGIPYAQYYVGHSLLDENSSFKNPQEGVKWITKSAEFGCMHSQYLLGQSLQYGKGIGKNRYEAAKWYRAASSQGHQGALICLKSLENITLVAHPRLLLRGDIEWIVEEKLPLPLGG